MGANWSDRGKIPGIALLRFVRILPDVVNINNESLSSIPDIIWNHHRISWDQKKLHKKKLVFNRLQGEGQIRHPERSRSRWQAVSTHLPYRIGPVCPAGNSWYVGNGDQTDRWLVVNLYLRQSHTPELDSSKQQLAKLQFTHPRPETKIAKRLALETKVGLSRRIHELHHTSTLWFNSSKLYCTNIWSHLRKCSRVLPTNSHETSKKNSLDFQENLLKSGFFVRDLRCEKYPVKTLWTATA